MLRLIDRYKMITNSQTKIRINNSTDNECLSRIIGPIEVAVVKTETTREV